MKGWSFLVEGKKGETCDDFCFDPEKVNRLQGRIPDLGGLAELFKVLGDRSRATIIYVLSREELCVCDLATVLGTSISNVSHHLRILRAASLVKNRRAGKQVYYSLDDRHVLNIIREGFDHIMHTRAGK